MNRRTASALIAAGALFGAGCGNDETSGAATSKAGGNGIDRAFVADMVAHHESAVEMAKIAQQRGESAFVKDLAGDIVRTQSKEIATMRREDEALAAGGVKRDSLGVPEHMMGMDGDVAALRTANPFDRAFLTMMIAHHEGAIVMARAELDKGADQQLEALAQDIRTAQQRELTAMREHLGETGASGGATEDEEHGADPGHSG